MVNLNWTSTRQVEQTQLVRVRVTSYYVDDVIIICVLRTCSTSYKFAWTCRLWSTRLSLRVGISVKWRWESPLLLYKMVFMSFKKWKYSTKTSWINKTRYQEWSYVRVLKSYILHVHVRVKRVSSTEMTSETSRLLHTYAYTYTCGLLNLSTVNAEIFTWRQFFTFMSFSWKLPPLENKPFSLYERNGSSILKITQGEISCKHFHEISPRFVDELK